MNVRVLQPADLEKVIGVYRASIHTLGRDFYTVEELTAWAPEYMDPELWRQRLAGVRGLIAEEDGVVAGFLTYDLTGHVDMLFILPGFVRRGFATRLYLEAEADLRKTGGSKVFTEASLMARPFFERQGFEVEIEEFAECRGQKLRRFRMSKKSGAK